MPSKGMKQSEEVKKHIALVKTKNRKCSVDGCDKPHEAHGMCKSHWGKHRRKTDPKYREKYRKKSSDGYYKFHEERKATKRESGKQFQRKVVKMLGGKCVACDEKFNPELSHSNIHIHHKIYSKKDEEDRKRIGITKHHLEIKKLIKNNQINELKEKFTLLCADCNKMEGFAKKDSKKTFDFICWLLGEGYLEEALADDPKLKKLSEFMK